MTLTASLSGRENAGSEIKVEGYFVGSSTYTTGETVTAVSLGLSRLNRLVMQPSAGFVYENVINAAKTEATVNIYRSAAESVTAANESAHTHAVALDSGTSAAGSAHSHTFTASNPSSVDNATVTYDASPGGNIVYLKFMNDGSPYLACNIATTTTNKMITFGTSTKVMIVHDASAASGGTAVKIDSAQGDASERIRCDLSTTFNEDVYIKAINGNVVRVKNSGTGTDLYFDDGVDQRLESAVASTANVSIGSYAVKVWLAGAATGTTANESSHTHGPGTLADAASGAGSAHTHTLTGAAGSLAELANGTSLTGITGAYFEAYGN